MYLSTEARAGLAEWAQMHKVTSTAVVEALGLLVAEDRLTAARLAKVAREVDAARRSRKP